MLAYSDTRPAPAARAASFADRISVARLSPISTFTAEAEIYAQGEKSGAFYQIEYGAVRIFRLLADGRRQVIAFHLAGETFGFEPEDNHHFFAETLVPTALRTFTQPRHDAVPANMMKAALQAMIKAQQHLLVIGRQNAGERIAAFLMDMLNRQGEHDQVELPMSRQDMADYLGLTIETVSRVLSRFRAQGVIRLHNSRSVELLKLDTLRRLATS
ncbi:MULTISPECIES: helix-turn-helix domain-containing protein [unclassified Rhizobium]|uniref:helix-turn-helix domain-containing protein n=1 Tax=unclassified Rhizobium TaxID=2613769 RepID=UPI00135B35FB|nr:MULTISPECIES: helix-turn-helix domain-containing protein [unclassified Rhizobium]